jgi:UDP-N-acetylmuramyl pentapeptide phosphotransferase/UDP-N-acetylglucosamine-1-phosphate transferase
MNVVSATNSIVLFAVAFVASAVGVKLFTVWSLRKGLFDVPNDRSSHTTPTPRGGGLVIVLVCLLGYLAIGFGLGLPLSWGYILGAILVAGVSWIDDLYSLPFWSRLAVHLTAAGILIWDVGFWSELFLPLFSATISFGTIIGFLFTAAWIVWLLNAYNFMDGIDGIAATQALIGSIAWAVLAWMLHLPAAFFLSGVVAAASAGFLIHNWQPAKIFMGDVGSAFLGFTLAAMPLIARSESRTDIPILPVVAVLFVWFFVFDTVFTLTRRLLARRRVWEAHREHIYQKLIIEGRQHSTVTLLYGLAATLLCVLVLFAVDLSGSYQWLAFLSLFVLTVFVTYLGIRKKR